MASAMCALLVGVVADCTQQASTEYLGNDVSAAKPADSAAACCAACVSEELCSFFTYDGRLCHLKNGNAPDYSRPNATCTSGYVGSDPPTPAPAKSDYHVAITAKRSVTADSFVCWNIDASENRGFFWRNYSAATAYGSKLAKQASALADGQAAGYSLLRFGGSGNDYLTYAFGGTACPPESECKRCLNETTWRGLLSFTAAAKARMIVGLSMSTGHDQTTSRRSTADASANSTADASVSAGHDGARSSDPFPFPWDPSNAEALLSWTIAAGLDHMLFGLELGNEQNTQYTAEQMSANFAVLHNLTTRLWPDAATRPKLLGPDPHSLHEPSGAQLAWLAAFVQHCEALGVPLHGATHHEYTEIEPTEAGFTAPTRLALSASIAAKVNETVRAVSASVGIYGGEIGPHNGGSPPCDHTSMRWAVYGNSFWYADALAAKARHGYAGFCRQDYIGADYGLVDCSTGAPLPDFFTALLWTHVMGTTVLTASVSDESGATIGDGAVVRAAAHCLAKGESTDTPNGGVGVLLINLSNRSTTAHFDEALGGVARRYVLEASDDAATSLTGVGGLLGTGITLNGALLTAAADGTVPRPAPAASEGSSATLPAYSIAFFILPKAYHPDCPWA